MNKSSAGVVFGEQSVLSFRQQPPSPFAVSRLPQCVREQRGGQERFAMNQQTQVQFNLQVPPNPAKLATTFNPYNASPVVIEKADVSNTVPPRSVPTGGFTMVSTDRLALAMRLAKRDILRSRAQQQTMSPPLFTSHENCPPSQPLENEQLIQRAPPPMGYTHIHPPTTHNTPSKPIPFKTVIQSSTLHKPAPVNIHPLLTDDSNQRRGDDKTTREIVRLQKQIQNQVSLLKVLKERNRQFVSEVRTKGRGQSGRVWRKEEEGVAARENRRKEEQTVRSARMVYNLSQQVENLQRDLNRLEMNSRQTDIRHTKKSQAMSRLAATHRTALRTLQSYHSLMDQPFSTELALLLQKLSLLSHQLEVGGSDDIVQQQLQELAAGETDTQLHKNGYQHQEHFHSEGKENSQGAVVKRIQFVSPKKKQKKKKPHLGSNVKYSSVLLDSQLQSQRKKTRKTRAPLHFTKQTVSSSQKQQPLLAHTPTMHSTPYPLASQDKNQTTHSEHPFKTPLLLKHNPSHALEETPEHSPPATVIPATPLSSTHPQDTPLPVNSVGGGHKDENRGADGLERITATLAEHNVQLEQLRTETRETLSEIQKQLVGSKVKAPSHVKPDCSRDDKTDGAKMEVKMLQSRSELLSLVRRIEELEGEEETIRQRWSTITYQDPLISKPTIVHVGGSKQKEASQSTPPAASAVAVVPPVPTKSVLSIEQYRERYNHYLQSTGMTTQGGFDPWRASESLADELLSEAMDQVVTELDQLCENYVENLYSAEFAQPS